jgi:signal transduction histidine kinase
MRLAAMLQSLLAYARAGRESGERVAVDLAAAVSQVQADLAASIDERGARIDVQLPRDASVRIDANDLRIILQNLISNAVKFGDAQAPLITVEAERSGDEWCVSVRDNGSGIAPADQQRIFGAFERAPGGTAHAGYGLGLAICHRLVERHGGRIGVESGAATGTRFWFAIRAA